MKFIADLHVHSKFSRATAKNLDLENLWIAAQLKGLTVVGTGDFTHPGWFDEIKEKLIPAEDGLYQLQESLARSCQALVPGSCRRPVRFLLESEVSNIYKKNGQTRKNHNLIFAPNIDVAQKINSHLNRIGNIHSDGRPILGLDARHLLEIVLEYSSEAFLVPAHIWTPWFSVLGSKSGFDSVKECFEDLTTHIFAVETGLSSDPIMNWRVSGLDRFTLVSNSDAHSPQKLGREANLFDTDLSYNAIRTALAAGNRKTFCGTIEFYPEEGKYHLDGHRKCAVCCPPEETMAYHGICPKCGKSLTLGVLYRVEQLADRMQGEKPLNARPYYHLIPLQDLLGEIFQMGPGSKRITATLLQLLTQLGPELDILHYLPIDDIDQAGIPLLGEAIRRMRSGAVHFLPGYDGEYGKVQIFDAEQRRQMLGQKALFSMPATAEDLPKAPKSAQIAQIKAADSVYKKRPMERDPLALNEEQNKAVLHIGGPLIVVAGPGTGKTRTLTQRILWLIQSQDIAPDRILAVTFTRKAAQEMSERLAVFLPATLNPPWVATFHSLCLSLLKELQKKDSSQKKVVLEPGQRMGVLKDAIFLLETGGLSITQKPERYSDWIVAAKQRIMGPHDPIAGIVSDPTEEKILIQVYRTYQDLLGIQGLLDYEDLILYVVQRLEKDIAFRNQCRDRFNYIFVDEYQDLNEGQYRMIKALAPKDGNLFVIGDPDQAIYGFRGSDVAYFNRFVEDFPKAEVIHLNRNYRSTETILKSARQVIQSSFGVSTDSAALRTYSNIQGFKSISVLGRTSEKAEAVAIGRIIEQMVGGTGYHALDSGKIDGGANEDPKSFGDFAVLYRTHDQGQVIGEVLEKAGIPCQIASRKNQLAASGLTEILCLFRVLEGLGTFVDFEVLSQTLKPGISKSILAAFKSWAYAKRLNLADAMHHARRIPIPSFTRSHQQKLFDFLTIIHDLKQELQNQIVSQKLEKLAVLPAMRSARQADIQSTNGMLKLIDRSRHFENDAPGLMASLALDSDTDQYDGQVEKVALMTMHAAKGLEFEVVFIAGCEEGLIPLERSAVDKDQLEEERRLFYVAMTRAKERLCLTWASKRRLHGQILPRQISPFVLDIEQHLQEHLSANWKKKTKNEQTQLDLF
jgi:uncharacterized protein (TIGR00375 family)